MSDQLNFKQVPFDTMYYNNLTKQGGQVLIECDPNRTVLKIIESCISKNNTVLTDAELAQWIFRYYIARTKNHVERVKLCAMQLKEFFQFRGYFARFIAKVQQHDFDKFSGNEHVASYALNCPLYKYEDLYEITPESKRVYEEIEWPKHHQLNDHHPEHYMKRVDPEKNQWMITDDEMIQFFQDKGGHPAALMALGEMVADWSAVGMEMGDTATAWWLKNKDVHWSYGPKYTQALEACLAFSSNKLVVDDIEPLPEPPKKKVECSSESVSINPISDLEDVSLEKLFIKDEALFKAIKRAQKVTSKEKLASLLKPGDLLMVYRHLNNMHIVGKLFYNMSTRLQGSSFSSIKIIAQDPKYLYGYGVVMNETGFKKVSTKQFLSSCSGCLILRNTSLTQSQLDKLFKWLDDRVDKVEYSVLKLIQSVATHTLGIADHVTKDQAVSYTSPMFCSTIFAYAMVATGINHGLGFSSISTVWPKDFATHSNWKPIYRYFEREEEADVVLEQQEPSAASYLPEVSTEGWFDPVAEEGMHYTIRNFPVLQFFNRLRKEYKTTKLEHLFEVIGIRLFSANRRTIVIHKFFIPELLYLLDKFAFPISLINTIKAHTWMSDPAPRGMIFGGADLSFIEMTMTAELYPHQKEFIQNYQDNKKMNHLRGALLSFEQGLGKTITALALMQGLKKEHVVIVCPKNTMLETWNHHLIKFFKEPQKTWIINHTKGPLTSHYKWIIVNYEQLEYVKEFLMKNKLPNLGIIVDESHNFLRTSSVRTQLLVDLSKYNSDADILLLSGTPVKCAGVELIPMMSILDPFFDEEAITIFKKTFGFNTAIANDVLNARLSRMMTRVTKNILDLPEKKESVVSVRMDTGWKYTASQVEKQIITFVKERKEYYNQNLHLYISAFEEVIEWLKGEPDISSQPEFQRYLSIIDYLRDANISDARGNADIVWANQYEINVLIPALPDNLKKQFVWSKSVVKYLPLKIKGEVIGQLLTRLRIQMTSEMMQAADLKQYVDKAMKKTIVFTSYVDTIELAYNYFKSNDYNPIAIYGKTASELTANVERFQTDQSLNPLIASLKMLSTGATLTAANTVIFLNKPWRSIEYQQASDRIHRIGQDTPCEIISLVLDTGKEANLSTRMEDIMQWSGDQFDQIVDKKEREMMKKFFRGFESLDIPEDCTVTTETLTAAQMKTWGDELYHGSPNNLTELKGYARASQYTNSVFLSPLKGIASIFVIDTRDLYGEENRGYRSIHWSYDVWERDISRLNTVPNHIVVYHNAKSFNETHGESTGYIYTVKLTDEIRSKLKTFGKEDTTRECRYVGDEPLKYTSKQKITVTWETKFDPRMVKHFGPAVESFSTSLEQYDPPYNEEQLREHGYPEEVIEKLKRDPVHSWRMKTGNELIHREPTRTELIRIWKNWQQMTPDQKRISDRKCKELFGCDNKTLYEYLIPQYKVESPDKGVVKYPPKSEESSSEAQQTSAPSKIAQKKKKILDFICKLCDTMEPSGLNSKRYRQIIAQMNDKEFDQFMNYMKEGKWQLHLVAPNMIVNLQNEDLLKACDMIGLDLFQKVWMYDRATGRKFLTDNKYMFVKLPIRRQQQFLDEKISVPDNDRTIDGLTGQVTGDSRSCSITNPEIQILAARGLDKTLKELVNVRGGNIHGYSEFRRMLEENGEADLDMIDPNSRTRASVVGGKLLQSMMLDTNL